MIIKKILFFSCLIILIPFIIVNLFIKKEDITFEVKSDDNPSKNTSLEESSEKLTPFQAVRFGRTLSHVFTNETDKYDSHHISPNINICILNINDDNTYDIYAFG